MKKIFLVGISLVALTINAGVFRLKQTIFGDFDWADPGNYEGEPAEGPRAGDTVVMAEGQNAIIVAGTERYQFVSGLQRVMPLDGAQLVIQVPASVGEASLACAVSVRGLDELVSGSDLEMTGSMVKVGEGTLVLSANGKICESTAKDTTVYDYWVNISVEDGILKCDRSTTLTQYFRTVNVANGAEFWTPYNAKNAYYMGWNGSGLITNDNDTASTSLYQWIADGEPASFSGPIGGKKLRIDILQRQDLLNVGNSYGGSLIAHSDGVAGIGHMGSSANGVSSIGTGGPNFSGSRATFLYLGEGGEKSLKKWWTANADSTVDAGSHGGFELAGQFAMKDTAKLMVSLNFAGSNVEHEAVSSGVFSHVETTDAEGNEVHFNYCINKKGPGIWRFADNPATLFEGPIAVEDGTLRFDSIAESGHPCSLGYSTWLYAAGATTLDNSSRLPYAVLLGTDSSEGTFEYTGTGSAKCSTRPIGIVKGRLISNGSRLEMGSVFAVGKKPAMLTLDGDSDIGNAVTGLSNGVDGGTLNITKTGSGSWRIKGENSFTGDVSVLAGSLTIQNNPRRKYHWYRVWISENAYGSDYYDTSAFDSETDAEKGYVQFGELAMYDSEGNNLIQGFATKDTVTQIAPDGDYRVMDVGEVAYGRADEVLDGRKKPQIDNLFDNDYTTQMKASFPCSSTGSGVKRSDSSTWIPLVVRVADNAASVVRVDFLQKLTWNKDTRYSGRNPVAFQLDGSEDGLEWDCNIASCDRFELQSSVPRWLSEPEVEVTGKSAPARKDKGFAIGEPERPVDSYGDVASVSVLPGGTLKIEGDPIEIRRITFSGADAVGTMENIKLAEHGNLVFENMPSGVREFSIPCALAQCVMAKNAEKWRVVINGQVRHGTVIVRDDGTLCFSPSGLMLIFR